MHQIATVTLELDSRFGPAHSVVGRAYEQKGMYQEAITEFRMDVDYSPKYTRSLARLGQAYALSGHEAEARKILVDLQQRSGKGFISPFDLATVYVALGEKQQALSHWKKLMRSTIARFSL